ncbi:MAG: site-2 protease family protein [Gammaproteobacteria bacterium]|nr:site-2 protease family protein [Gammaproteobacteria bacterium]
MFSIIWFVLVVCVSLLLLVGLHEFGHYIVAKFFSVPVERFVISPLGGFIQIQKGFVFESVAKFKRACIILAGPVFNFCISSVLPRICHRYRSAPAFH